MSWRRQVMIVFLISFLLRFLILCILGPLADPPTSYNEQCRIALYLLHGTGFVSPVGPERNDPSSWYAPGFIAFMACVMWFFGEHSNATWVTIHIANLLAQSGAMAVWFLVGRVLLGRRVAVCAAFLMTITLALPPWTSIWDTYVAMFAGSVSLAVFILFRIKSWRGYFMTGALCGATALINPFYSTSYPLWFLWKTRFMLRNKKGTMKMMQYKLLPFLVGFGLVILPWTVRNCYIFKDFFYIRGNLGFELWIGNAPSITAGNFIADFKRINPIFDKTEADRLVSMGEYAYFKACRQQALKWIADDPLRIGVLSIHKIKWFWIGQLSYEKDTFVYMVKILFFSAPGILSLIGAWLSFRQRSFSWLLQATLFIFPLPYYFTTSSIRYRQPIEPLVLLFTSVFLIWLFDKLKKFRRRRIV